MAKTKTTPKNNKEKQQVEQDATPPNKTQAKKKTSPKTPTARKGKVTKEVVEVESGGEEDDTFIFKEFMKKGKRLVELSGSDLVHWPKTENCKFYVDRDARDTPFALEDGSEDKVSVLKHNSCCFVVFLWLVVCLYHKNVMLHCQLYARTADGFKSTVSGAVKTVDGAFNTVDGAFNTVDGAFNTVDGAFNTADGFINITVNGISNTGIINTVNGKF